MARSTTVCHTSLCARRKHAPRRQLRIHSLRVLGGGGGEAKADMCREAVLTCCRMLGRLMMRCNAKASGGSLVSRRSMQRNTFAVFLLARGGGGKRAQDGDTRGTATAFEAKVASSGAGGVWASMFVFDLCAWVQLCCCVSCCTHVTLRHTGKSKELISENQYY